jgi:transposase
MRDVREVLRLHREGCVPMREVARMMGIARSTVRDMIVRFERLGLEWPVPAEISDPDLCVFQKFWTPISLNRGQAFR